MDNKFTEILDKANDSISKCITLIDLQETEKILLDKNSVIVTESKRITEIHPAQRKEFGQSINETKNKIQSLIDTKRKELKEKYFNDQDNLKLDITYRNNLNNNAWLNPITTTKWLLEDIFLRMGFSVDYPYELDTYENTFEYVNIPKGHPAADSWDTFYTEDGHIPITHTSSMQNRILKRFAQNLKVDNSIDFHGSIIPGRCFRNEATDGRHEHTFNQLEGIVIGKGIKFSDMLGTLKTVFTQYFEKEIELRVIPDYFPFVEPGNGVEIKWDNPDERILKITHGTGWLEVLGCGLIHPNVLNMAGIDSDVYTGFAWGTGIERLYMIKSGIEDLRLFHSGNRNFLEQFKI